MSYLPVMTLQNKVTHEIKTTTDPPALITGLWKDVAKVKGPVLRGLASRATYFHNDKRFNIGFTSQEKEDLVAFLSAL